jgi:hypothetical protein
MVDERSRVLVPRRGLTGLTGVRSSVEVARRVVRSGANPIGEPGGVLFRREHYFAVGGWRPERRHAMDLDLWLRLLQCGEFLGLPETLAAFRVAQQSLSVENEAGVYEHQKAIVAELAASPALQVRQLDSRLGDLLAPTGRLRRRTLFGMSKLAARRGAARRAVGQLYLLRFLTEWAAVHPGHQPAPPATRSSPSTGTTSSTETDHRIRVRQDDEHGDQHISPPRTAGNARRRMHG